MKMAYIATDPKTNHCYAICSADPEYVSDCADDLKQWKRDGAKIELLPSDEAKRRFCESLPSGPVQQIPLWGGGK